MHYTTGYKEIRAADGVHIVPCCKRCGTKHPTLLSVAPDYLYVRCEACNVQFYLPDCQGAESRGRMNTGVIWQRANSKLVIDFCKGCDRILFNDPLARFENCDDCQREITLAVMEASAR